MKKSTILLAGLLSGASMLGIVSPAAPAPTASSSAPAASSERATPVPGVHYIRPAHAPDKCITVHGWDASDAAKIDQWTCHGQRNQRWTFMDNGAFRYWVKSEFSNKCLDGGDLKKGHKVTQRSCHSAFKQAWYPVPRGNTYEIHVGTQCLDVQGGSRTNGARIILWKCKNVSNQRFYLN